MFLMARKGGCPVIGMIVPPAGTEVPPEPKVMYPEGIEFIAEGLGLERLSPDGYDAVIGRVGEAAARLADRGADAIALMGTSLSFYKGPEFKGELVNLIERTTGLAATTMSDAVVAALQAVGAGNVAVGTAYRKPVNDRLRDFLRSSGLAVACMESLDIENVEEVRDVGDDALVRLSDRAMSRAPDADALFLSCGGLQTWRIVARLEARHAMPVVTSATAGAWAAVRLVGLTGNVSGFGRFAEPDT